MEERYIAAIEISSSKVIGTVGKIHTDGQLEVIAVEQERGLEAVRHGVIQNLEETSMRISSILQKLQRRNTIAPRKIIGVFVGLSGRSMRSLTARASLSLSDDTEITEEILERLRRQALDSAVDHSLEVIDAVPRNYHIGGREISSPKGMLGSEISATFDLVVCRPELKRNITRTLPDKLHVGIAGFIVTALATGALIPSREEKRLGCMLVDMGAETTTVTIYKNGSMCYFATIPLGGRNITRDITTLNVLEERAEELKLINGVAMPRAIPSSDTRNGVKINELDNHVLARSGEIVANIIEQIEYAGLKSSDLPGGIIVIGGASRLNQMEQLLQEESNMTVRRGKLPDYVQISDTKAQSSELLEVVSILYAGATHSNAVCLEIPKEESLPATGDDPGEDEYGEIPEKEKRRRNKRSKVSGWTTRISNWFGSNEDDSDSLD
ncbi:MAG: cell division protein FtsA [Bacteroidales bacterium]|nr:cell division protein FtsA [Bacteroidales bacterium]